MNAEYWKDWEKLGDFDDIRWTCEVLRDPGGNFHMIWKWDTIDGKMLPDEFGSVGHFFNSQNIPYDASRVGMMVLDRVMTYKKALKIWISYTTPTDLQKFLTSNYK